MIDCFYDENNQLNGYKENNTIYFYIRDVLGNIIGILNNSGVIVSKFDYDAFGNIINQTGSVISNFRYKGYYYDTDIELYYLKSRFYNPVLLRFITPDSIEYIDSSSIIGLNLYAYCGNDPINMIDENGNFGIFSFALIVVGVCILVSTVYTVEYHANKNYYEDGDEVFGKQTPTPGTLKNGKNFEFLIKEDDPHFNKNQIIIKNSSTYSIDELSEMIDIIMDSEEGKYRNHINKNKVLNELKWHKIGYNFGYKPDETASANVYFNADDEEHGFFSWVMNNIYI
ncbi:MAG: RHS repeat-associated core domain-containing protein [Anaeroplasma sp.]|uniref:RHS repeat domain-containing protein n=1 Tax=Anaeroplasma sp. TaxID=1872523 RepID=UPI002A90F33F|nr:RHS repeat-associated core domain-containing protein [Anaeroplasma sp.]MDY5982640.1 RHS repeat-associated core domain-containing protein [Anaeroplasma sp.]